ncbi:MAG: hypothetical protein IPH35_18685 [Rhodoferax sp.]|nr:hypothetical protein [Rhodoferax sp.]
MWRVMLCLFMCAFIFGCVSGPQVSVNPNTSTANTNAPPLRDTKVQTLTPLSELNNEKKCDDIDAIALIAAAHAESRLSIIGSFGLENFSSRIGKATLEKKTYAASGQTVEQRFKIRAYSFDNRKNFCGSPTSESSNVSGYILTEIERTSVKCKRDCTNTTTEYLNFSITANSNEAGIIDGKPFGKFAVLECVRDKQFDFNSASSRLSPVARVGQCGSYAKPIYCAFGNCVGGEDYPRINSIEHFTQDLYKREPVRLTSISGLPHSMAIVVDTLSGKLAREDRKRKDAATNEFMKSFTVKIVDSKESQIRAITDRNLLSSMAGSCKDITKRIVIEAKEPTKLSRDVNVKVVFTLKRTYAPLMLEKEGDPLTEKRDYVFNAQNKYRISDVIKFDCVLASGRFHTAGLSLLGALSGTRRQDTGVLTTLTKTGFEFDIEQSR